MDVRVISIGALESHPLWNEAGQVRTGHATTSLIQAGDRRILIDPGLPSVALAARLSERSGLRPGDITDVFLTSFKPETTRALPIFENATWWLHENEREGVGVPLVQQLREMAEEQDEESGGLLEALKRDVANLQHCKPAPDKFVDQVDLFPLFGMAPGLCGLIISEPMHTTVVCGDAIPTVEHLQQGTVLKSAWNIEQAQESMQEAIEIADILILGRDNIVINPTRRPF